MPCTVSILEIKEFCLSIWGTSKTLSYRYFPYGDFLHRGFPYRRFSLYGSQLGRQPMFFERGNWLSLGEEAVENEGNQRKISILLFFSFEQKWKFLYDRKKFFHTSDQFRGPVIEGKSGNFWLSVKMRFSRKY